MNFPLPDLPFDALSAPDLAQVLRGATGIFVAFTLIVTRMSGMVVIGPVFGHPAIPLQIRVFLVLAMSFVITPVLLGSSQQRTFRLLDRNHDQVLTADEIPGSLKAQFESLLRAAGKRDFDGLAADEFRLSPPLPDTLVEYAGLALVEFGLGIALGLGVMTIVSGLQMAGSLIDAQIGVSLGSVFNPEFESDASLSGELLHQLGLVVFLIVGGHHLIVSALIDTFQALPVGYAWLSPPAIELLSGLVHQSLVLALQIAAPMMGMMAVVGLAMGFLGHTIPQLNVLIVGFPVRTLVGLAVVGLAVPGIADILAQALPAGIQQLRDVLMGYWMAEDLENGDRTELPTDRRREEIRERGNVARSIDLNIAVSVLVAAGVLYFFGDGLALGMVDVLRKSLSVPAWTAIDTGLLAVEMWSLARVVAGAVLPGLALVVVTAVLVNALQVGFLVTTEPLMPSLERINPLAGARRLLSLQSTVRLAGSLFKLVVCCAIVVGFVTGRLPEFLQALNADTAAFCRQTGSWLVALSFQLALGLVVLAGLDYGFQLWKFEQDIKMTKQEVRDELRHMEGDPHIRHRRREAHRKLVSARQVQQTRNADVVVTNPTEIAVAIKYDARKMEAPIVLAKGAGPLAARIRRVAVEHGIPIVEKKPLAQALYRMVKVGQAIPVELYEGVAEILAYVYRLTKRQIKRA